MRNKKALKQILGSSVVIAGLITGILNYQARSLETGTQEIKRYSQLEERVSITEKNSELSEYAGYIANHEGKRFEVYCARNPKEKNRTKFIEPTIGVGHYLDRNDSKETIERILPEVDYNQIYEGSQKLNTEQVKRLFEGDLEKYVKRAEDLFQNFDNYPIYLKKALVDGVYRGCLSGSPKTIELINNNKFKGAAKEYLNHNEYKNAVSLGIPGIRPRMEKNRDAILRYHQEKEVKNKK